MKYFTLIITFFTISISNANTIVNLQKPTAFDSLEVIMALKGETEENKILVFNSLKSMLGVNYTAFCDNHGVFLFYIDKNLYRTPELFYEAFIKAFDLEPYTFLKGGKIKELMPFCDFKNYNDAEAYKLSH